MIIQAIIHLENCNAHDTSTVCNGSATNKAALQKLGITGSMQSYNVTFKNPVTDKDIHAIIDVPHCIKCTRNNLLKANVFKFHNGDVKMEHFHLLLAEEEKKITALRAVPKLKSVHVTPNTFQKMNVSLATQLLSESVASGLQFYQACGVLGLQDVNITVTFVRFWNRLFDALNRKLKTEGIRRNSDDLKVSM